MKGSLDKSLHEKVIRRDDRRLLDSVLSGLRDYGYVVLPAKPHALLAGDEYKVTRNIIARLFDQSLLQKEGENYDLFGNKTSTIYQLKQN